MILEIRKIDKFNNHCIKQVISAAPEWTTKWIPNLSFCRDWMSTRAFK